MNKSCRTALVFILVCLALSGCALFGKKKKPIPAATLPTFLGRVAMVDTEHRFVLLDSGAAAALAPGTQVVTFRDKRRTAVLRTTGESQPPYVALAILVGEPALGDQGALEDATARAPAAAAAATP